MQKEQTPADGGPHGAQNLVRASDVSDDINNVTGLQSFGSVLVQMLRAIMWRSIRYYLRIASNARCAADRDAAFTAAMAIRQTGESYGLTEGRNHVVA